MLISYVRCMRYAIGKSYGLDYSDNDVMLSKFERVQKKYTPFARSIFLERKFYHKSCYSVFGTFIYFRFWNRNHYDYYMIDIPSHSLVSRDCFFDFSEAVRSLEK